jgi:hypothetical protein
MALQSKLFRDDERLQACLVNNAAHVQRGASGDHVARIQQALRILMEDDGIDSMLPYYNPSKHRGAECGR